MITWPVNPASSSPRTPSRQCSTPPATHGRGAPPAGVADGSLRERSPYCISVMLLIALRQREAAGAASELATTLTDEVERMSASLPVCADPSQAHAVHTRHARDSPRHGSPHLVFRQRVAHLLPRHGSCVSLAVEKRLTAASICGSTAACYTCTRSGLRLGIRTFCWSDNDHSSSARVFGSL